MTAKLPTQKAYCIQGDYKSEHFSIVFGGMIKPDQYNKQRSEITCNTQSNYVQKRPFFIQNLEKQYAS